jgi:hypothetical protein
VSIVLAIATSTALEAEVVKVPVILERSDDRRSVVGLERGEDRLVSGDAVVGPVVACLLPQVHRHGQLQLDEDRRERDVELSVVGEPYDGGVEGPVRVIAIEVVGCGPHALERLAYGRKGRRGIGQRQRRLDRVPLEDVTQREQLQDIGRRPLGDPGAAAREMLDEALLAEQPKGFAQRRAADAEIRAQLFLDDLVTGLQGTAQDRIAQPVLGDVDERRGQAGSRAVEPCRAHPLRRLLGEMCSSIVGNRRNFSPHVLRCGQVTNPVPTSTTTFAPALPAASVQVERLIALGVHDLAGLSADALRGAAAGIAGNALFALHPAVVPASALAPLVLVDDRRAFVVADMTDVDEFTPVMDLPDQPAYAVEDLDRGDAMRNWSPDEAASEIASAGRSPLLLTEGLYWLLHQPEALERGSCFMTIGSRKPKPGNTFDTRTPAVWISNGTGRDGVEHRGAPKVGWCWWGNRHTWLGMASAAGRLPVDAIR